jgi:hypothetical protein
MLTKEVLIPFIVTNTLTLVMVFVCFKWPKTGKRAWGILFMLAAAFNAYTAGNNPQAYLGYGDHAIGLYKNFINGIFASHTALFIYMIAFGQFLVGLFLLRGKKLLKLGILGGIIFFIAITPLGLGSAFPSTLLMALSLIILYKRLKKV